MAELTDKELKIKRTQRGTIRANVTKGLKKLDSVFAQTPPDVTSAKGLAEQLRASQQKLQALDESILPNVPDDKLQSEVDKNEQYQDDIVLGLSNLRAKIEALTATPVPSPTQSVPGQSKDVNPKLPKLEIPKYNGDPLLWDEFWDNFSSSIHERPDLPVIDKFKYLKSFLEGDALRLADGYRLTNANYDEVVQALKERFGDPELATFSHFEALIALKPASYSLPELRAVLDKCESHIRSLVALGLPESTFGIVFTPLILSKLPKGVKVELHRKNGSTPWRLGVLRSLLKEEINAREKGERVFAGVTDSTPSRDVGLQRQSSGRPPQKGPKPRPVTASTLASATRIDTRQSPSTPSCVFCNGNHYSSSCSSYKDIDSRLKQVQGRCHCCLRTGHRAPQCRSKRPCYFCKRDTHHQSLCRMQLQPGAATSGGTLVAPTSVAGDSKTAGSEAKPESSLSLQTPSCTSILQTALAKIKGPAGETTARLYFDTGGSRSFISTAASKKIGAKSVGQETVSIGRFRDLKQSTISYKIMEFDICLPNGKSKTVRMSSETAISCPIQLIPLDPNCAIVSQVNLAEPLVQQPTMVTIDILVGNDYYYSFIGPEQIRCSNGIVLLSSPFGFVAGGSLSTPNSSSEYETSLLIHDRKEPNYSLERFWCLEDLGIKENYHENDDEMALRMFNETICKEYGRYFVKWPWKEQSPDLQDNYGLSVGRLKSLVTRLRSNEKMLAAYDKNIQDQRYKGIIEESPRIPNGAVHYIPHHCVINPSKETTKLRIVYDASAKQSKNSPSLNECLYRGPVFLANAVGILIRWRLPTIAMVSDIEKAFLQVGLQVSDRDVTRFLWLKDIEGPVTIPNIQVYRFCRVPFGVVSSPFLLAGTIGHHLKQESGKTASEIENNVYVDNIFGGASTVDAALEYYREAKSIFAKASMNLREWYANSSAFLNKIEEADKGKAPVPSVLGLKWNTQTDRFYIPVSNASAKSTVWTKRRVLQSIASVYDPCGLVSPVTVTGKLLMQQLWRDNRGWDEKLSQHLSQNWLAFLNELVQIPSLNVNRQLGLPVDDTTTRLELHCFCDASTKAYSAAVYLLVFQGSQVTADVIFVKTRVAPVKSLTVPRLELMAVLIGTRCMTFVEQQLPFTLAAKYLWTDSSCALHWVNNKTVSTVFVQNRVREIRSHRGIHFSYVPSSENPADVATRGVNFSELKESQLWWRGPAFLTKNHTAWPRQLAVQSNFTPESEEEDVSHTSNLMQPQIVESDLLVDTQRFSSLLKLFRVTAFIMRFVRYIKGSRREPKGTITALEIESARQFWHQHIQSRSFPNTLCSPTHNDKYHNLKAHLGLFVDSKGLIRCKGRYIRSTSTSESDFPLLLPKNTHYTDLVIADHHQRLFHAGVKHTLAEIRQKYWIIHGRNQVKRVLNTCRLCRYYHSGSFPTPQPANLPDFRLTPGRAFQSVGLDYLGPLFIRDNGEGITRKIWICLFTCAAVRAIHLEVVEDLTTQQFLLCLRRFIATYGRPKLIISDNAKQFHTAAKTLDKLWKQIINSVEVQTLTASEQISWKFIPELTPWMGGFYERLIGLTKTALKKALHQRCAKLVELQTIVKEIASIINSRPLIYSEASVEDDYLTPAHFLGQKGQQLATALDSEDYHPVPLTADQLLLGWKRNQAVVNSFWKSWQSSYLQSLQQSIWKPRNRNKSTFLPKIGTVVLVKDKLQRSAWKIGIIIELIRSHDDVYRSAIIRLPSKKTIRRPLKLLFPLEYANDPAGIVLKTQRDNTSSDCSLPARTAAISARARIRRLAVSESSDDGQH